MKGSELILYAALGALFIEYTKPGTIRRLLGGATLVAPGGPGPGSTTGGLTYDQACAQARTILGGFSSTWLSASCADIAAHVKADSTLFVPPNPIRAALVG